MRFVSCSNAGQPLRPSWTRLTGIDYIPPSHQHIFGRLSDSLDLDAPSTTAAPSRLQSPLPNSLATPPPDSSPAPVVPTETIGDALRKALAPNRKDGPGFLRAMERYNTAMEEIQSDGSLARFMAGKTGMSMKEWSGVVGRVHESAYSRVVGSYANELEVRRSEQDWDSWLIRAASPETSG